MYLVNEVIKHWVATFLVTFFFPGL